ncbi:MAG: hypothetical protein HY801_06125 [Candidatus Lindowbacteria bacterium]|nr:hypothetical protein [Candidatus Lindowbacteria bacterium]
MPPDDGFRPDEDERFSPIAPESCENNPEEPVSIPEMRSLGIPFQDIELMPEREGFQGKRTMRPQR